ncbi:MAG: DHA1 family multidrug resistance protein-like MFS transporter [Oleiphilaceae bacterium]|jgi:predicted MFS family arabinose efflux permease
MSLKTCLILLTIVSVIADTMLLPFYPQFFQQAFNQSSPEHVGYYIAACCFTVMCAFPLWAKVAKHINELHLWVYTQIIAGALGVACYFSSSLIEFWLLSQTMLVFKASYLLIYPFVMRLEDKDKHLGMVGLFSVLMHFGGITGALLGGVVLQYFDPRDIYLIMAASDGLQVMVCLYLIIRFKIAFKPIADIHNGENVKGEDEDEDYELENSSLKASNIEDIKRFIFKLGLVTALFYFSAFLIRPFFTLYWQSITRIEILGSDLITGLVYSLPGWVAVIGLWLNSRFERNRLKNNKYQTSNSQISNNSEGNSDSQLSSFQFLINAMLLGTLGLLIQGSELVWMVILGRCVFGWAMFQATVRLEVLLFEISSPSRYATDFSKMHFMQNLGVITASFCVGSIVTYGSYRWTFYLASIGFILTLALFYFSFKPKNELKDQYVSFR